jgi:hypothetical protein
VAEGVAELSGLGELTWVYPPDMVDRGAACGRAKQRRRLLPARLVVYLVLASALSSQHLPGGAAAPDRRLRDLGRWGSWRVPAKSSLLYAAGDRPARRCPVLVTASPGVSPRAPGEIAGVVTSQAPGLAGALSRGQRSTAIAKASCAASSARSKSPRKPINAASTRPHRSRKTCPRVVTNTVRPGAPRLRPQDGPPGSARPARSSHRGRRPPRRSSRRSPP